MNAISASVKLDGQHCLVVGGGSAARDAARRLLALGARVRVAAPCLEEDLQDLKARQRIGHHGGCFSPLLLEDCALVVAATDKPLSNRWVAEHAARQRIAVCVPQQPEMGNVVLSCDGRPADDADDPRAQGGARRGSLCDSGEKLRQAV